MIEVFIYLIIDETIKNRHQRPCFICLSTIRIHTYERHERPADYILFGIKGNSHERSLRLIEKDVNVGMLRKINFKREEVDVISMIINDQSTARNEVGNC